MVTTLLLCLLLGVGVGILAGLLGVGGGLVIVPTLIYLFTALEIPADIVTHLAVGTSLATIVVTSIASVRAHHRRGAVRWEVFALLTPGIVFGSLAGAAFAGWLPGDTLRRLFGLFALLVSLQLALRLKPAAHRELPGPPGMSLAGMSIGAVSAVVGIGGGSMTVPFLTWCNLSVRQAVAVSAACGLPIALAGTAGFVVIGWENTSLPPFSTGFIYWPAFLGIVTTSMLFAGVGARLAHTLPAATLKRVFALFLALVGIHLLSG